MQGQRSGKMLAVCPENMDDMVGDLGANTPKTISMLLLGSFKHLCAVDDYYVVIILLYSFIDCEKDLTVCVSSYLFHIQYSC